jgi:hypothetical protein
MRPANDVASIDQAFDRALSRQFEFKTCGFDVVGRGGLEPPTSAVLGPERCLQDPEGRA